MSGKSSPEKKEKNPKPLISTFSNGKSTESNFSDHSPETDQQQMFSAVGTASYNGYGSASYASKSSPIGTNLLSPQYQTMRYTYEAPSHTTYSPYTRYNHGQCGLENLGTTCFMNSILQCLNNIPALVEHYLDYNSRSSLLNREHPVSTAFANLIESMRKFSTARPTVLKSVLCQHAPQLLDFGQQDSHEFLTLLLDVLHRESSAEAEDDSEVASVISNLFQGQMEYTIKCSAASQCKNVTKTTDPFLDVPVFIDDKVASSSPTFKVRFVLIDGEQKMIHFPYSLTDTIQSIIDHLQKTSHAFKRNIIVMKVTADNTFSAQYRSLVLLSQIDDQSTIFYEIDESNTTPVTMCLFLEKNRSSLNKIYNWPPVLLKLPFGNDRYKLDNYLSNHFDSSNLQYDIGDDPFVYTNPTYSFSHQKTIIIHINEKIMQRAQLKLETQPKKIIVQTRQDSSVALEQCLENNISVVERTSSDSTWFCPHCQQNRQLTKENLILSLPQVLIIHLKRFDMESSSRRKIETFVKYPLELNMRKFVPSATSYKEYMYDLIGVCLHSGSFERGHYTAYTKKASSWFCFNDSSVEPISINDVVNRNAYILFYSRRAH